jgi:hypothetical protein
LHEKDVNLSFVPFDLPLPDEPTRRPRWRNLQVFYGKMMEVGRCLRSESLPDAPQVGGGPVLEAVWGSLLRHCRNQRKYQQEQYGVSLHLFLLAPRILVKPLMRISQNFAGTDPQGFGKGALNLLPSSGRSY